MVVVGRWVVVLGRAGSDEKSRKNNDCRYSVLVSPILLFDHKSSITLLTSG